MPAHLTRALIATALGSVMLAATAFAGQRGAINEVQGSAATVEAGTTITFTARGSNPCGAVNLTFGDGTVVTYRSASCRPPLSMYLPSQAPIGS